MQALNTFLFKDILVYRYSQKKSWTVSIKQIYFFNLFRMPSNAEGFVSICGAFPDHAVDLVYEAVVGYYLTIF
jgi:hypothetical protein